jgi:C4-dicarboxylate transporter DctM subunit
MMIIYGVIANVSIADLFLAGIVPGVSVGLALMGMSYYISVKHGYGAVCSLSLPDIGKSFLRAIIPLLMPLIILGGVLSGVFTATEAGVVATAYAFIVGKFIYKTLHFRDFPRIFINSAVMTSVCLFVIAQSSVFGRILALEGFPYMITSFLTSFDVSPVVIELMIVGFILFLGLFIEGIPVLIIFAPIFIPVISKIGLDLVHFGVVLNMAVLIGSVTPPVGILLYICCNVAGIEVSKASIIIWPFVAMMMLVLLLCLLFPSVVLFIPRMFSAV